MLPSVVRAGTLILAGLLLAGGPATAQVIEQREGDANPMVAVFKSTIYGGGAGAVLGLAVALADDDDSGEPIRWGFVAGTFFGFGYGLYHVATRPEPGALLEHEAGGWAMAVPDVVLDAREPGARLYLATFRF